MLEHILQFHYLNDEKEPNTEQDKYTISDEERKKVTDRFQIKQFEYEDAEGCGRAESGELAKDD